MPGKGGQHVIEEADSGRDLRMTGAIEIDAEEDFRLRGLSLHAGDTRLAHGISFSHRVAPTAVSASLKACISVGVPADTRNQPSGPVSRINTPRSSRACHTA